MNILKNKYFLLGNLAFILIIIPVTLFIIRNQTSTRGSAAPTTTLSFNPPSLQTDQCSNVTSNLVLNPGQNVVATVKLQLSWDATKFNVEFTPNTQTFPQVLSGPEISNGSLKATLTVGADVTKAVTTTSTVGTLVIKPLAPTNGTPTQISIDTTGTEVRSLADGEGENVFNAAGSSPLQIAITAATCTGTTTPSPTVPVGTTPTPTPTTAVPTTTPTNLSPICSSLASSTASGSAPVSLTFTAVGNDPDGTIQKATFNFGDGTVQDVTTGMGTAQVTTELAHTFTSGGTFVPSVTFTDNSGAISNSCTSTIALTGGSSSDGSGSSGTGGDSATTPTTAPQPSQAIDSPGGVGTTLTVIGGIILTVVAGLFFLAL